MSDFGFLTCIVDPFGSAKPLFVVCEEQGSPREISLSELSLYRGRIITFDAWSVAEILRRTGMGLPACIIETGDALRILSGVSRDEGGEPLWDVLKAMKPHFENPDDANVSEDLIKSRSLIPDRPEMVRILSETSLALRRLWIGIASELISRNEEERFWNVEVPIQQIFLARQMKGIRLENGISAELIETARRDKYIAFRQLAATLGFSPAGLNFRNVGTFLSKTDASHLSEFATRSNFEDYFKIAQNGSTFASAFVRFKDAERDLSVLTRIACVAGRTHPVFSCFGTVTGRILVADPRLQELRRKFRGIIAPDIGHSLLYLDYAQFEPGILASLSGDDSFRLHYETSDLYQSLSLAVFGDEEHREICKKIFLAYCYGMSTENIAKLLAGANFSLPKRVAYHDSVSSFFKAFPALEEFRRKMQNQLKVSGCAASLLGNRRIRRSSGELTNKERRWAVNQVIQATASLIFKSSLIDLASEFGKESIVLPIHDAVLLQYDPAANRPERVLRTATAIMVAAFRRWCPTVTPKVVQARFAVPLSSETQGASTEHPQLDLPFSR